MRLTFRTKTALLTTSLVLILVSATGVWQYRQLSSEYVSIIREQQQALTQLAASDLDYKLGAHLDVLVREARRADASPFLDRSAGERFLKDSGLQSMFDGTAVIGLDGTVVANDPPNDRALNISDREYFRRARDGGETAISAPLLSRATNEPVILMATPAKAADGRIVGVVGAGLNLGRANVLGDLARTRVGKNGYYVVMTQGPAPVFVVHPDPKLLLQPATQFVGQTDDDPSRDLTTHAPIGVTRWMLHVVTPAQTAYAPLESARRALLLQLLWLGLGCSALVWIGMTWLMRPLAVLHGAIRVLRQSPDSTVRLDTRAQDERGDLAREFDALMSELKDKRAETAAVTDASPLGLFRCNTDGRITYVNDAYLAIHGFDRADMQDWLSLVPEAIRDTVREDWLRILQKPEPYSTRRWLRRRDGSDVLVAMHMRPILAQGVVTGHVGTVSDLTESTRAEQALRTLTAIFEATTDYVVQLDAAGRLTYMNPAARRRTGVEPEVPVSHLAMADFNPPETLARLRSEIVPFAAAEGVWVGESVVWGAGRKPFPVSHMVIAHRDKNRRIERYSAVMRDISAAKATEEALQESEARLRTVADALPMRVAYVDAGEHYRFMNVAYEAAFGRSLGQLQGRTMRELLGEQSYREIEPHVRAALQGRHVSFQRQMKVADAGAWYEAHYIPQLAADGATVTGFHSVITDISAQKREEQRLVQLARVDPLTGLSNRAAFELRLAEAMALSRADNALMALLYVDIDRFKQINDQWGHQTGDAMLKAFAARVSAAVRSTDQVARLGGDEFTVIMEALPGTDAAARVAEKIVRAMDPPVLLDDRPFQLSTSIGVAFYQGGPLKAEALIRRADEMLYAAKGAGRNNFQLASFAEADA